MFDSIHKQVARWIRNMRVRTCRSPFVVYFLERSGSTHLCTALNSHPDINCRYEDFDFCVDKDINSSATAVSSGVQKQSNGPFVSDGYTRRIYRFNKNPLDHPDSRTVITHLYNIFSIPTIASGFKFKFPIHFDLYPEIVDELENMGSRLRIIVLTRRNLLKQAISKQNMHRISSAANGGSNLLNSYPEEIKQAIRKTPFKLDIQRALTYSKQITRKKNALDLFASELEERNAGSVLKIEYEDLAADARHTVGQVFEFLTVDRNFEFNSTVEKATPNQLRNAITNFDELARAVANSELEQFLSD